MMTAVRVEAGLLPRLERLTGDEASECAPVYRNRAREIRQSFAFRSAVQRARVLADENRLLAIEMLREAGELCACEIQAGLGLTHATVSHHMRRLTAARLVTTRRKGKWSYYSLTDDGRRVRP
ncbi:MAG: ArsR/SmtB family transcription factor [Thermoplasmata archaeon]